MRFWVVEEATCEATVRVMGVLVRERAGSRRTESEGIRTRRICVGVRASVLLVVFRRRGCPQVPLGSSRPLVLHAPPPPRPRRCWRLADNWWWEQRRRRPSLEPPPAVVL
ncbi:hypothetical protein BHE74_00004555 [Ensete ventricosum]|nr:hypothetical protein GW17_00033713 [Ensete ventricosum]RWW86665.1 hypothetical protein BHE74_00004555 [Ensete ventricosum]RZR76928.1 hypothetical protein BHM03_00001839 [Ensete ventricosum]